MSEVPLYTSPPTPRHQQRHCHHHKHQQSSRDEAGAENVPLLPCLLVRCLPCCTFEFLGEGSNLPVHACFMDNVDLSARWEARGACRALLGQVDATSHRISPFPCPCGRKALHRHLELAIVGLGSALHFVVRVAVCPSSCCRDPRWRVPSSFSVLHLRDFRSRSVLPLRWLVGGLRVGGMGVPKGALGVEHSLDCVPQGWESLHLADSRRRARRLCWTRGRRG